MILVGNSLSFCVGDLLSGEQTWPEGQKLVLVACTCLTSPEEAYKAYSPSYWRGHSKEVVMALLERLWPHVVQPRQYHLPYSHFAGGSNWFVTETLNPREITNELIERDERSGMRSWYDRLDRSVLLDRVHEDIARAIAVP